MAPCAHSCLRAKDHPVHRVATFPRFCAPRKSSLAAQRTGGHRRVVTKKVTGDLPTPRGAGDPARWQLVGVWRNVALLSSTKSRGTESEKSNSRCLAHAISRIHRTVEVPRYLLSCDNGRISLVSHSARQSVFSLASQCAREPEGRDTKEDYSRAVGLHETRSRIQHRIARCPILVGFDV